MKIRKKVIILLSTYFTFLIMPKIKSNDNFINYNSEYDSTEILCFAEYNDKKIFIANADLIESIIDENDNNIYIIDERFTKDPNISICNSYRIKDNIKINDILKILEEYEKLYPSDWDRTFESMKSEWIIHNICYDLNINRTSTQNVDLNNNDQNTYDKNILTKILK